MGSISFEGAPIGITSTIAQPALDFPSACTSVHAAWAAWLPGLGASWPAPTLIGTTEDDLIKSLVEDNKLKVPYTTCENLIKAFTKITGADCRISPHIDTASQRLKAMASEIISVASTIRVARAEGLIFIGAQSDINSYFGTQVWDRRWAGFGPDYLFSDNNGNPTFVEVKGEVDVLKMRPRQTQLRAFSTNKTQSINAQLTLPACFPAPSKVRHVLSRVRRTKTHTICVQWFNEQQESGESQQKCYALLLAVALSNYHQVLRALLGTNGIKLDYGDLTFGFPDYAIAKDWRERAEVFPLITLIPINVVRIFSLIAKWFYAFRNAEKSNHPRRAWHAESSKLNANLQKVLAFEFQARENRRREQGGVDRRIWEDDELPLGIVVRRAI